MPEPASNPAPDPMPTGPEPAGDVVTLDVDRVATGGAALGAGPDGRVVFVTGAIPGERVAATVTREHRARIEAKIDDTAQVLAPSPDRVEPPCPHVAEGCGGCDWQHITAERQRQLRIDVVADCLRRLGRLENVDIRRGPELPVDGYRTTVRAAVVNGKAAYRIGESHDTVSISSCQTAHPLVEEILVDGYFGQATEVTVRAGANTGERLVVIDPAAVDVRVPDDVTVVGVDQLEAGERPHYHEEIGGLRLQISARSFFQCRPDGALALAQVAGDAIADTPGPLLDAYSGVGLFGALNGMGRPVLAVESDPSAVADARWNLRPHGRVEQARFERWAAEPAAVAIVDPARSGLRAAAADVLVQSEAKVVALVSCDPASLARDASLLVERGYRLDYVTVVDLFGHTSHVETVSRFVRTA